jgi:hypothetical protein
MPKDVTKEQRRALYREIWLSHVRSFRQGLVIALTLLRPLAQSFAPILGTRCETCGKCRRVLWMPMGDHRMCGRLVGDENGLHGSTWGTDELEPPF